MKVLPGCSSLVRRSGFNKGAQNTASPLPPSCRGELLGGVRIRGGVRNSIGTDTVLGQITKELTCTVFPFAYACGCVVSRVERGGGEWGWRGVLHIAPCAHRRYPPVHIDGAPLGTWTVHPVHMDSASYVDSSPCAHGQCILRGQFPLCTWKVHPAHMDSAPRAHRRCSLRTWTVPPAHMDSAPCAHGQCTLCT